MIFNRPRLQKTDTWHEHKYDEMTSWKVRVHSTPRKKLFDFEESADTNGTVKYGPLQLTLAWFENGKKAILATPRHGRRSMMLDQEWVGMTIYLKTKGA